MYAYPKQHIVFQRLDFLAAPLYRAWRGLTGKEALMHGDF